MLRFSSLTILLLLSFSSLVDAQNINETLFKNPSNQYKPKTWMHAMSGNMSKEGITKDLEAMKAAGLGGFLLFNISQGIPNGKIIYNSPEHHEMLTHAAKESHRLGLSFGVHNCDGWSSSGGSWVKPEESMKMVVWSEKVVNSNGKINLNLSKPTVKENFYRDIAVIAYPSLLSEINDFEAKSIISTSDSRAKIDIINDQKIDAETSIKQEGKKPTWIQFDFGKAKTIRSVYFWHRERNTNFSLESSDDGINFKKHFTLKKVRPGKDDWANNVSFEPITARFFRISADASMNIKELQFKETQMIENVLGNTSIARTEDENLESIGKPDASMIIDKSKIIDLSKSFNPTTETLQADLPVGNWTILRFGYTSTGAFNTPASKEGTGLEVDKLSRTAFKSFFDVFNQTVINNAKKIAPNAMQYIEIDSYEKGGQNWTEGFDELFIKKFGYDLKQFLPLFAGKFIESTTASESVLDDLRELVSGLMTENYYGYFTELCHQNGIKSYIEPYGFGPVNNLEVGGKADIPMGEFWMNRPLTQVNAAIFSAHIYGKSVISAESFTSEAQLNWKVHPALLKKSGDRAWAAGINEFMFHRFAHQSNTNVLPGMTMNRWGSHIDRTQHWWLNAGAAWFKYISRGSYLLQSGIPVSDLLVFVGDGSPNGTVNRKSLNPNIPMGTNFDCVNADVLINRIKVENGDLVLPEGTRYKVLVLDNAETLKFETLKRIHELAQNKVLIIGKKPVQLRGYNQSKSAEFQQLVNETWAKSTTISNYDWKDIFEKHQIKPDFEIEERKDIDFQHRKMADADVYFVHNPDSVKRVFNVKFRISNKIPELWNAEDGSIVKMAQFVNENGFTKISLNLDVEESVFVVFREESKNLITIKSNKKSENIALYFNEKNQINAKANQNGDYKIEYQNGKSSILKVKDIPNPQKIEGAWQVDFKEVLGYGGNYTFEKLIDWKDHQNEKIKYYSGTATYRTTFDFTQKIDKNTSISIDLGNVAVAAKVKLNGKDLGVLWKTPYQIDISDAIKTGKNDLEIEVTNLWTNRLIGDERFPQNDNYQFEGGNFPKTKMPEWYTNNQPRPEGERKTFTTANFYKSTDALQPSGLLGDVVLRFAKVVNIKF
jgi:hypothetical protein